MEDGGSFYVVEFNLYLKILGIYQNYIWSVFSYNDYSSFNFLNNFSDNYSSTFNLKIKIVIDMLAKIKGWWMRGGFGL
ncbi:MAG: hypothetical protein DRP72_04365, partial [Candidatus Omnitrophota bacterium]